MFHVRRLVMLSRRVMPALFLTLSAAAATVYGDNAAKPRLPAAVERVLRCLPETTETVVVAQAFEIDPRQTILKRASLESRWSALQSLALGDLLSLEGDAGLKELVGRSVAVAVNAGRDFEAVSSFGSLRYQGCSVVRFQEPLPDAGRRLIESMRGAAKEVRTIARHDVFVFEDRTAMEPWVKAKPWQGQFIALPAPDMLVCATSDLFLREVLDRLANPVAAPRALRDELPEWKQVDANSPVWALRHVPEDQQRILVGLTWCLKPKGRDLFEVRYLPVPGQNARPKAETWSQPSLGVNPSIDEESDGTVIVTVDTEAKKLDLWHALLGYAAMGESSDPEDAD